MNLKHNNSSIFYFLLSRFSLVLLLSIFYFLFSSIQIVHAHEEGATGVTPENAFGPFLAFAIIILAIAAAKRIKKRR